MKSIRRLYLVCLINYIGMNPIFSQKWDSVGPRMNTFYNAWTNVLYSDSNYLYMAGRFKLINGMHMQGIARWNGTKWDSMGAGIEGVRPIPDSSPNINPDNTFAMVTYHNKLYVGGAFNSLGHVNAGAIGTWNGIIWDTIPVQPFRNNSNMGPAGEVLALTVINNKLYMGGEFDTVAGFPCIGIACWNDTNWSSLNFPGGFSFENIASICEYKRSIYVAGHFAGNNGGIGEIIRLDSTGNWHSVDTGIKGISDWINTMAVYNGELYVGGYFYQSDGNVGNCIQKWDGTKWSDVGGGVNYQIWNLTVYNGKLYALGVFTEAGGIPADGIAKWDGTKWCSIDSTSTDNANPTTATIFKDSLYVGNEFVIDGYNIPFIAEWIGGDYVYDCGQPTGVNETKTENTSITVYPNPSNGMFTFQANGQQLMANSYIEIYNMLGEKVYSNSYQPMANGYQLNLSNQPNGIYLYRVITETGNLIGEGKLIIQR